ncbi:Squamous cell carcinoma antigen recognized by T-cells 3 [Larimichthys crocea]|uniref:Uncharacterized protein n=1 Tax=Larimichthys crocea TaxID=215358 RepID=A0ACD3Q9F0_LARCR|nr:Squamous cell carcinoma antigen recognized by T-cells 3 [Larimichthys crocea]
MNSAKVTAPSKMFVWSRIAQEKPKGLAYVEFAEEAQAAQAVQKMDGMEVDGNKISVAISNPPRRNMMDKPGSNRPTIRHDASPGLRIERTRTHPALITPSISAPTKWTCKQSGERELS